MIEQKQMVVRGKTADSDCRRRLCFVVGQNCAPRLVMATNTQKEMFS